MKYYSLNHQSESVGFIQAMLNGLAPDGGLYHPETFPRYSSQELLSLKNKSLMEIAISVLNKWLNDEFLPEEINQVVKKSLNFDILLRQVNSFRVLELFHGPTMAFKDIGASVLAQLMNVVFSKKSLQATILVATSGDTGGAVAQGFSDAKQVKVVILFPKGRVSRLQEEQLTRVSDNVIPVEIEAGFDECQIMVKKAFVDPDLQKYNLTSANSINIGRLIPQIIYYVYTFSRFVNDNIELVIPSGNLGNATAALFACKMGIPLSLIIGCNANDCVDIYEKTSRFMPKKSVATLSNAMDIGNPSNFRRLLEVCNNDHSIFKTLIKTVSITDSQTVETIKKVYLESDYLLDPHTAVAWRAAELLADKSKKTIIVSTASPVKFASELQQATGIMIDDSQEIKKLRQKPKRKYELKNDYHKFKQLLKVI